MTLFDALIQLRNPQYYLAEWAGQHVHASVVKTENGEFLAAYAAVGLPARSFHSHNMDSIVRWFYSQGVSVNAGWEIFS